jgi:hypothetical protein
MARKRPGEEEQTETVQVLAGGKPEDVDVGKALVHGAPVVGSVMPKDPPPPAADAKKVRRFRVTKGGTVSTNGYRATLKEGKELDDLNYDIRSLATQGIHLEEIQAPTPAPVPAGY